MMWYYGAGVNWIWMTAMMLVVWGGLIFLGIWAVRALSGNRAHTSDSAMDLLRKRFAAGEISSEEFEKSKKVLGA